MVHFILLAGDSPQLHDLTERGICVSAGEGLVLDPQQHLLQPGSKLLLGYPCFKSYPLITALPCIVNHSDLNLN